jgi:hypothetical protein
MWDILPFHKPMWLGKYICNIYKLSNFEIVMHRKKRDAQRRVWIRNIFYYSNADALILYCVVLCTTQHTIYNLLNHFEIHDDSNHEKSNDTHLQRISMSVYLCDSRMGQARNKKELLVKFKKKIR